MNASLVFITAQLSNYQQGKKVKKIQEQNFVTMLLLLELA